MILKFNKYIIPDTYTIKEALVSLDKTSDDILTLLIIDNKKKMIGTLTDGDLRRGLIHGKKLSDNVKEIMNKSFRYISDDVNNVHLIKEYKENGIKLLPYLNSYGNIEKVFALNKMKSILPIDVVIMAGGKGERLRPLTLTTPKPLLQIGNKSIIDYNIDSLISYGVENINVTINYLGEQLQKHFRKKRNNIKINCIKEHKFLGTIGSVILIKSFKSDYVLIMNSDLFTNINYEDFFLHFIDNKADMSVAVISYSVNIPYGIFDINGIIINGLSEKPSFNYYANAGIYIVKKNLLNLIPNNLLYNATDFIDLLLEKKFKIVRYPITGYWIDIGKHEDYKKAQELINHL